VAKEELIRRLIGRRVCKNCGATYHIETMKPKVEGVCDVCGGELVQRADDNRETVENRIDVYEQQTMPLIDYYDKAGVLVHIDGSLGLENVFTKIREVLGEKAV
jgi:adenylate kinase